MVADDDHPYAHAEGQTYEVHGVGQLESYTFAGAAPFVVKYFANPDGVANCLVHTCNASWVIPTILN